MAVQYRIGWEVAKDKLLNSQIERDNTNLTYAWKKKEKAVKKRKKLLLLLCYFLETLLPLLGPDPLTPTPLSLGSCWQEIHQGRNPPGQWRTHFVAWLRVWLTHLHHK